MRFLVLAALLLSACQSNAPTRAEPEFQVIPLQFANASDLALQLMQLAHGQAAGLDQDPIAAFIADPRTNSLLVRARPENMAKVHALVAQLDQSVPAAKP